MDFNKLENKITSNKKEKKKKREIINHTKLKENNRNAIKTKLEWDENIRQFRNKSMYTTTAAKIIEERQAHVATGKNLSRGKQISLRDNYTLGIFFLESFPCRSKYGTTIIVIKAKMMGVSRSGVSHLFTYMVEISKLWKDAIGLASATD